jgi:hypothetical protein
MAVVPPGSATVPVAPTSRLAGVATVPLNLDSLVDVRWNVWGGGFYLPR